MKWASSWSRRGAGGNIMSNVFLCRRMRKRLCQGRVRDGWNELLQDPFPIPQQPWNASYSYRRYRKCLFIWWILLAQEQWSNLWETESEALKANLTLERSRPLWFKESTVWSKGNPVRTKGLQILKEIADTDSWLWSWVSQSLIEALHCSSNFSLSLRAHNIVSSHLKVSSCLNWRSRVLTQ